MYSGRPKLEAKENAPFWQSPVATEERRTINNVNAKYQGDGILVNVVDMLRRRNTPKFVSKAEIIRLG